MNIVPHAKPQSFAAKIELLLVVAEQSAENPDVISGHPQIIDALHDLADDQRIDNYFPEELSGSAYLHTLADELSIYRSAELDDTELIQSLTFSSWLLTEKRPEQDIKHLLPLA